MRKVTINGYDVSTFCLGTVGEHNATQLVITPPHELLDENVAYYRVLFKLRNRKDPYITDKYYEYPIEVNLVQTLTLNSSFDMCVVAYDNNDEYLGISKKISGFYFNPTDYNGMEDAIDDYLNDPVIGLQKVIDGKADITYVDAKFDELDEALDNKVDKVDGKGLSTNDFTDEYKNELDEAYQDKHTHENKEVLDELGESQDGKLTFKGEEIGGGDVEALTDEEIILVCSDVVDFLSMGNSTYFGVDSENALAF